VYSLVVPRRRGFRTLYADTARIARSRRLDAVLDAFESDLQSHLAEWAPRRVFVHAGVVGWRGRAIVMPGRSMSGKTSLVAELIRAGAVYYSDEYAVLDQSGRVHPFARPLALRTEGGRRERHGPEAIGARVGCHALPVGLVVVSRYRAGARWRPRVLPAGEGALALLANTVAARRAPERVVAALQTVVTRAQILRGVRGEARETARALLGHLAALDSVGRQARIPKRLDRSYPAIQSGQRTRISKTSGQSLPPTKSRRVAGS
jgi:hypothetical protein